MAAAYLSVMRLRELLCYDPETGIFIRRRGQGAGLPAHLRSNRNGYGRISLDGHEWLAHRLAWLYVHGAWPSSQLDHINRNKLDNRICNLRLATHDLNQQNHIRARRTNKIGLLGVSLSQGKWRAQITVNRKKIFLGRFDDPEQAHSAYLDAKARLHIGAHLGVIAS